MRKLTTLGFVSGERGSPVKITGLGLGVVREETRDLLKVSAGFLGIQG
jgi:uncharacterized protein YjhX (UPF0386 family)